MNSAGVTAISLDGSHVSVTLRRRHERGSPRLEKAARVCVWPLTGEAQLAARILLLALGLLLCADQAFARGSGSVRDQPWDSHHIDDLPAEVRHYIAGICRGPAHAQHDFATYSPHEQRWRINIEYLRCNGLGEYRRGNQCLDVDFIEVGSRFLLGAKQYRDCGF